MQIRKTLTAGVLAVALSTSGAQAGTTSSSDNSGILIGALILGVIGLLIFTSDEAGDSLKLSTKNGPDLPLPSPEPQVLTNF